MHTLPVLLFKHIGVFEHIMPDYNKQWKGYTAELHHLDTSVAAPEGSFYPSGPHERNCHQLQTGIGSRKGDVFIVS